MKPRIGFLGVGWIGKHRLEAIASSGAAEVAAICDVSNERALAACAAAPGATVCESLGRLLELPLDGIAIATPSALHAEHAIAALECGRAVFCQKPLARNAVEARVVVDAARAADRLLHVDLSYRFTDAMQRIRDIVRTGGIGRVFAIDLVFHNAYGPDAPWFYDKALSGGGCVIDLGIHLVDLALWLLGYPEVETVDSHLQRGGAPVTGADCEDYATARLQLATGCSVRLACSWRLSAGRDAVIEAAIYGTEGAAALRNVNGSFFDFVGELYRGTTCSTLAAPPDAWGGRAAVAWAEQLGRTPKFDAAADQLVELAAVIDAIYARGRV